MKIIERLVVLFIVAIGITYGANTGAITGYVTDPSGAIVPGATMSLKSIDTGVISKSKSDDHGFYQFPQVAPGQYDLTVEVSGFRKETVNHINVMVEQMVSYNVKLQVGQVSETVEVSGGVNALIEPEKVATSSNIAPSMVENLPVTNRTFDSFWALAPGTTQAAAGSQSGSTSISAAGARTGSMNQTIDGINNIDRQVGAPINKFRIADAVEEFSVTTTVPGADVGRQSGPQINVITRSGTNTFHGGAFWFLRNDALQADNFFTNKLGSPKPILRQDQFGGTIGGPVILPKYNGKNKTFFFFSWESLHQNAPSAAVNSVVPTVALRNSILDPVAKAIVAFYPLPNIPNAAPGAANFVANPPSTTTDNTYLAKVDQNFGDKDHVTFRYLWYGGKAIGDGALLTTGGTISNPGAESIMFSETHIFSPTFIGELRGGFSRDVTHILPQDYGLNAADVLVGIPGVYNSATSGPLESGLPQVSITGYATVGRGSTSTPQELYVNTYDLINNYTKVAPNGWSRHTFKFGGDVRREEVKRLNDGGASGTVSFTSFANFAGTCATCAGQSLLNSSSIQEGTSLSYWYRYPWALYFQDNIKLTRTLTLNIGLRYEYPSAVREKTGRGTNFVDGLGPVLIGTNKLLNINPNLSGPASIFYTTSPITLPPAGTTTDKNNFAPISGFAYTPQWSGGPAFLKDGKTVIRGGFRISYDETYNNVTVNQSIGAPWNISTTQRAGSTQPAAGYGWNLAFNQNVPFITRTTQAPGAPAIGLLNFYGLSENPPTAYAYNWNLGVQRELTRHIGLDVSYIGSAGHKFGVYINPNQALPVVSNSGYRASQAPNEQYYPFPEFGTSSRIAVFDGNSIYNALVATAKIHLNMLDMVSTYSFSHSIDNDSTFAADTYDAGTPVNRNQMNLERGNSANDQRQRFLNYFVFSVPFGAGRHYLNNAHGIVQQALGGWQISAVTNLTTGQPFTVWASRSVDFSGFGTLADRPDIQGSGPLMMNYGNPDAVFSPAYFGKIGNGSNICPGYTTASGVTSANGCAPAGRVGDSPRNGYRLPGAINLDMTVGKRFPIRERLGMTFRADFFNVMNHTNFTTLVNTMSSSQFGQFTAAAPARVIQLTLRLDF
jgi:hypothetical protein